MASTPAGEAITAAHRQGQLLVSTRALAQLLPVWRSLDLRSIRQTWPAVETAALGIIQAQRPQSARLAAGYYTTFRVAEGVEGVAEVAPVAIDEAVLERAVVSLRVTGLLSIERAAALKEPDPLTKALVRVSGAVTRHVLDGGRATIEDAISRDRRALGYARVTSGKCCYFCAMLASRGPVYRESTVGFRAHDHCACSQEAVFRSGQSWPGRAREWRELYNMATQGEPDAALAFRRAYEGRAA